MHATGLVLRNTVFGIFILHSYYFIQFYVLWELINVTVTDCVVSFFALVNGNGGSTVLVKQTELRGVNALLVL